MPQGTHKGAGDALKDLLKDRVQDLGLRAYSRVYGVRLRD